MMSAMQLNLRAGQLVEQIVAEAATLRVAVQESPSGGRVIDCGIGAPGGLEAGRRMAQICLAGLANVSLAPAGPGLATDLEVQVHTDHPIAACMASQYAGWRISAGKYFAMGSGPMRAAYGREELFDKIAGRESAAQVVGVLEAGQLPPPEVIAFIAERCGVPPADVALLIAPTASIAGAVQVVARSVETALHKLLELGFDLSRVVSGYGRAPLPPIAKSDLSAIGRTNDAILYGGRVTLWVRGDDRSLLEIAPQIPSRSSPSFGQPFEVIFERAGRDFYKIDPRLFSPAEVTLVNLDTGRAIRYGGVVPEVLDQSFHV